MTAEASTGGFNRLEKYTGSKEGIRPEAWLRLFELDTDETTDNEKIKKLMYYLSGDALEWFSDDILANASIKKWDTVKTRFIQRFGSFTANPIVLSTHRRLCASETVEDYYKDKLRLMNQTGLNKAEKVQMLTDGLPLDWKDSMASAQPDDTTKWLQIALSIEQNRNQRRTQQNQKAKANIFTAITQGSANASTSNTTNCPFFCPICKKKGIKVKHWISDCTDYDPNYKKEDLTNTRQTAGTNQEGTTPTLNDKHSIKTAVLSTMGSSVYKLVNMDVKINDQSVTAFVDTGATISVINEKLCKKLKIPMIENKPLPIQQVEGETTSTSHVKVPLQVFNRSEQVKLHVLKNCQHPLSIGLDVAGIFKLIVDTEDKTVYTKDSTKRTDPIIQHLQPAEQNQLTEHLEEFDDNRIKPDPAKIKVIDEFPTPTTVKQVRQFLSLASYYRRFIKDFASIASPLTKLTRKNQPFLWNNETEEAFTTLKTKLTQSPILTMFNPELPCRLYTDASKHGIGAILTQEDSTGEHVVSYYSRKLLKHQENYSAFELECFAVIQAVEHYEVYLDCKPFEVITDHWALQWLLNMKKPKAKFFRWIINLSSKTFTIKHRAGTKLAHVDALSRAPVIVAHISTSTILEHQQKADLSFVQNPQKYKDLTMINQNGNLKCVIPSTLKQDILKEYHDNYSHPSMGKTIRLINPYFWWPRAVQDIKEYVRSCKTCQIVKHSHQQSLGENIIHDTGSCPTSDMNVEEARKISIKTTENYRIKWKEAYDAKHQKRTFEVGDSVLKKIADNDPKLIKTSPRYSEPMKITKKLSNVTFEVVSQEDPTPRRVHISNLKPFVRRTNLEVGENVTITS